MERRRWTALFDSFASSHNRDHQAPSLRDGGSGTGGPAVRWRPAAFIVSRSRDQTLDRRNKLVYSIKKNEYCLRMRFARQYFNHTMFTKMDMSMFMNAQEYDILNAVANQPYVSQRELAERCGHSLGMVNGGLRALREAGYLDEQMLLTDKARRLLAEHTPKNAVILAAGAGMRMVPINMETPKGLLEVRGETLIERLIRQLHEAGVTDITVVVGFMKEAYEFLIDQYGVELAVNRDYAAKSNLHSLALVIDRVSDTYVMPCDVWCEENPFSAHELYGWYMVTDGAGVSSNVQVNRKRELVLVPPSTGGNAMIGISYLPEAQAKTVRERVRAMAADPRYDNPQLFWEMALYEKDRLMLLARVVSEGKAVEINTYEQLRELDSGSSQLRSDAIEAAAKALHAGPSEITDIELLKKGMTNRSFLFACRGRRYIMRIPGEGTQMLIDRRREAAVYAAIEGKALCDAPVYMDPVSGYKITRYIADARVCDPEDEADVRRCMEKLRYLHRLRLTVDHDFDIFGGIDFYESLWNGAPSAYRDYDRTKRRVFSLRGYIDAHVAERVLTHIDAVPDNFLIVPDSGQIQLTDWEYAGMQDPHVDVAMFCIYSLYDREQTDRLIDTYFEGACPDETRTKIYCYIAACGLLWSNWCEYKRSLGVEFGEYSLRQYRYAKQYSEIVLQRLKGGE